MGNRSYNRFKPLIPSNKQYDILSKYFGYSDRSRDKVEQANDTRRNTRMLESNLTWMRDEYDKAEADYNKSKAALNQKYNQAKIAINQDPNVLRQIDADRQQLEDEWNYWKNTWQRRFDAIKKGQYNPALAKDLGASFKAGSSIAWDATKTSGSEAYDYAKNNAGSHNLSPSFYRDVAAAMSGRQPGNLLNAQAKAHKAMAKNAQNDAANRQMEAQKSQQIADRNEYTEAGKVASMQNDAQNRQNIANKEGITGSAAALMRQTNTPDITAERQRQDQQRNIANNRRQEADVAQQGATRSMGDAEQAAMQANTYDKDVYDKWASINEAGSDNTQSQTQDTQTQETQDQEQDTQNTEQSQDNPYTVEEGRPEAAVPKTPDAMAGDPRFQAPLPKEDNEYKTSETGLAKYQGLDDDTLAKTLLEEAKGFSDNYAEQHDQYERLVGQLKEGSELNRFLQDHPFPENTTENTSEAPLDLNNGDPYEQEIVELVNEAIRKYPESSDIDFNKARLDYIENALTQKYAKDKRTRESLIQRATEKLSDENLKVIHKQLSDCRMKWIRHDWDTYGKPDKKDFEWLLNQLQDDQIGINEGDNFEDDTVLKGYADNIRNYVYNYKPEAMAISSDNDPNVTHIGPMAQDIEKVNPACIHKDKNGIESVDTGRVAMMNAGAIGDLARSLEDIKARLIRLEARNV